MRDFLGRELHIGDECVYLKNCRTGSSTVRKVLFKGVITRFTECKVGFDKVLVNSDDVVKVSWSDAQSVSHR